MFACIAEISSVSDHSIHFFFSLFPVSNENEEECQPCVAVSRPHFYEILLARGQGRSRTSHFVLLAVGSTDGLEVTDCSKYSSDVVIFCRDFGIL